MDRPTPAPSQSRQPICIVGLGCVLPGAATVEVFWENIAKGRSAIVDLPEGRWSREAHVDPDPEAADKTYACKGGFVDHALLNELADRLGVDRQAHHRLSIMTMEACRQALDGYAAAGISDAKTDVILGCMAVDESVHPHLLYRETRGALEQLRSSEPDGWERAVAMIEDYFGERLPADVPEEQVFLTTSILHQLKERHGLRGEGMLIDAACASSLAAIDVAVTRLREGCCDLAITGGIEGDLGAATYVMFSKVGALAKEHCLPFDARTEGLVQGEGAVIFALQRLDDAISQHRPIYGIIAGCGGASDGRSGSLFSPTSAGQKLAFERAYHQAGDKSPDYVECHGTGTQLGDATEIASLGSYFEGKDVHIGSVKALIGHTKGAAGAAGLLKAVLALQHRAIPPSPHAERPLHVPDNIKINREPIALPPDGGRAALRFGVSSFGFGNINYHLVLDEFTGDLDTFTPVSTPEPDEIVLVGSVDVTDIDIDAYLARTGLKILPSSLPQTDRYQLLAVIGALEAFKAASIDPNRIDRDNIAVIAASCLCLPSTQAFDNRIGYDDLLSRLAPLGEGVLDIVRRRKERLSPVSEDTGPGILNNVIAGKVCNLFDFMGKSFNVDADFMSVPAALDLAKSELRQGASLALVLCAEEGLSAGDPLIERRGFRCLLLAAKEQALAKAYPIEGILGHVDYQEAAHG